MQQDIEILLTQIRNILTNKPEMPADKTQSEEFSDLQEAISYLSFCMIESNEFLKNLSTGHLDVKTPSRHNFMASNLKELHSGLRHLTWQANQVANGDYSQKVSFLGEFSDSFNQMKDQLEERENKLKRQATGLKNSVNLMVAIMDGLTDWVVVTHKDTGDILYKNRAAKVGIRKAKRSRAECIREKCPLMQQIYLRGEVNDTGQFEFDCTLTGRVLRVENYFIQWNDKMAYVHFISDITDESGEKKQLETMAFIDELTGFYNRRYCVQLIESLLVEKKDFSVCLFDLDNLKKVNDTMGHLKGDEYIKIVTVEMMRAATTSDKMCRIGGDEFVAIAIGTSEAVAREQVRELDANISAIKREYEMSVSSGVVYVQADMNLSSEDILNLADKQMYSAKQKKKAARCSE